MKQILRKWRLATLVVAMFAMLSIPGAFAEKDQGVAWDPNTEADLAGYRIYMSGTSNTYEYGEFSNDIIAQVPAGTESVTIHIPDGTWYLVATAYDTEGLESPRSEIELTITTNPEEGNPPGCVMNFRFS